MSTWPELSTLLGDSSDTIYGINSGGIKNTDSKDVGCTLFLYRLNGPADWTYLGPLIKPRVSAPKPTSSWVGDWGENWECGGFFQFENRSFVIIGPQGTYFEPLEPIKPEANPAPKKWQSWASGALKKEGEGVDMEFELQGILDWGCIYAAQSFVGEGGKRLLIGEFDSKGQILIF
jgi:hypothetical protein